MTEDSKYYQGFTAEDIERYYNGKMSSLEMHQLEKAAMEDPMLADALEGYAHTSTPVQDMEFLRAQLQSKTERGKLVPVSKGFGKNQFLRIAALFILLAGCGWAVYQFGFNEPASNAVAVKAPAMPPAATDSNQIMESTTQPAADSKEITDQRTAGTESAAAQSKENTNASSQITTIQNDGRGTVSISTQNRHTGKPNEFDLAKKDNAGKQEGEVAGAVAGAADAERNEASLYHKNKAAEPQAKQMDSVTVIGYGTQRKQTVSPGKENVIVLQRDKAAEPIPEVVLSSGKRDSTNRRPRITFEEAEPESGTAYYDDYVINNLQMPEEELKKNISGEVKLSFDVNEAGEAVNIKVEKSLCTECDKEAIRILKEGPKWKKKKDKKGKLSIKF